MSALDNLAPPASGLDALPPPSTDELVAASADSDPSTRGLRPPTAAQITQATTDPNHTGYTPNNFNPITDLAKGVPETASIGVASLYGIPISKVAKIGAEGARLFGADVDPAKVESAVSNYLIPQPTTDFSKNVLGAANLPVQGYGDLADLAREEAREHIGPGTADVVRQGTGAINDFLGLTPALPAVAKVAGTISDAANAARVRANAPATNTLDASRAAGFNIPAVVDPNASAGQVAAEHAMDATAIIRKAYKDNTRVVPEIARQEAGLPQGRAVTPDTLEDAEKAPTAVYQAAIAATPTLDLTRQFRTDVSHSGQGWQTSIPESPAARALREHYLTLDTLDGETAFNDMKQLRHDGFKALASDNPEVASHGRANLDISNALEAQISRQLQATNPDIFPSFLDARVQLAKIHTLQDAFTGDYIDPQKIARMARKNPGIDGGLQIIAQTAENAPKVMGVPQKAPIGLGFHNLLPVGGAAIGYQLGEHMLGPALGGGVGGVLGLAAIPGLQAAARGLSRLGRNYGVPDDLSLVPQLSNYYRNRGAAGWPAQPGESLSVSSPTAPTPSASPGGLPYSHVLAGDLSLGEHTPSSGLSLAPDYTPGTGLKIPPNLTAYLQAGDTTLGPINRGEYPHPNNSDLPDVMAGDMQSFPASWRLSPDTLNAPPILRKSPTSTQKAASGLQKLIVKYKPYGRTD